MSLVNCPECNKEVSDKAGNCPQCGYPIIEKTVPALQEHRSNKYVCPICKSQNIQTIKMMCENGTTTTSSTGGGVSSDFDVAVGRMNSESQTELAKKFAPGDAPGEAIGGCGCLVAILFFVLAMIAVNDGQIFVYAGIITLIITGIILYFSDSKEWNNKVHLYENGWICHKCGNTWINDKYADTAFEKPELLKKLPDENIYKHYIKKPK